jgi:GGDEF domain-containing protein
MSPFRLFYLMSRDIYLAMCPATIHTMLKVQRIDGHPVSVQIGAHDFACEDETGHVVIPREFAAGFRLSDIPEDISIKPVERIEGQTVHIKNDIAISRFRDGAASTDVEEIFRRKFWDGETGLTPYVVALRQSIAEDPITAETDFQDDGDFIFLHYDISIGTDLEIQEALDLVDAIIERIHKRADQLVARRKDGLLGIFDRGSFDADLRHILSGAQSTALILADIDHFKKVNDSFGHPVGDQVLSAVARVLYNKCDGCSRVAYRYGGEELAVVVLGDCMPVGWANMALSPNARATFRVGRRAGRRKKDLPEGRSKDSVF